MSEIKNLQLSVVSWKTTGIFKPQIFTGTELFADIFITCMYCIHLDIHLCLYLLQIFELEI